MPTRLKPLRRMKGFPEIKLRRLPIPTEVAGGEELNLDDPVVREIHNRMGGRSVDWAVAKRVAGLKGALFKTYEGTIPELIVYDWLEQKKIPFSFQAFIYGGRSRKGGVIPDFLVWPGGRGLAWFVDTEYWHSKPEVAASDAADRVRLLGAVYDGIRIDAVVALWENQIYRNRPAIFEWAMMGVEMGR